MWATKKVGNGTCTVQTLGFVLSCKLTMHIAILGLIQKCKFGTPHQFLIRMFVRITTIDSNSLELQNNR